jgi:hypothetical protein
MPANDFVGRIVVQASISFCSLLAVRLGLCIAMLFHLLSVSSPEPFWRNLITKPTDLAERGQMAMPHSPKRCFPPLVVEARLTCHILLWVASDLFTILILLITIISNISTNLIPTACNTALGRPGLA